MSSTAKAYIAAVIVAGAAAILWTAANWVCSRPAMFAAYAAIGLVAAAWKVRLPGMSQTISLNFLFVLIGVSEFSLPETMALGCASTLVQTIWKARKQPGAVKILFNFAVLAISVAVSHSVPHALLGTEPQSAAMALMLTVATVLLYLSNTGLVAGVISLADDKPYFNVWRNCFFWSFPFYGVGAAVAGLVASSSRTVGPYLPLSVLPLMYMLYAYYRLIVDKASGATASADSAH